MTGLTLRQDHLLDAICELVKAKGTSMVTFSEIWEINHKLGAPKQRTTRADIKTLRKLNLLTPQGPDHAQRYQPTRRAQRR